MRSLQTWADSSLSSIAVCSLHGCYGSNLHIVVFLLGGFACGLFCGAGLVLSFWATYTIRDGGRSPATAEAVSVCVGHGQYGSSGVRRGTMALSPTTDSEGSFDSGHAQHHRKAGFSLQMATCIRSSSESRRRQEKYGSTRGTNLPRRQRCLLVATWSRPANSELAGAFCSPQKSSRERFSELRRRRARAGRVRAWGYLTPCRLQQRQTFLLEGSECLKSFSRTRPMSAMAHLLSNVRPLLARFISFFVDLLAWAHPALSTPEYQPSTEGAPRPALNTESGTPEQNQSWDAADER